MLTSFPLDDVTTLTFDIFGTVLDLAGSLSGPIAALLSEKGVQVDGDVFWRRWRERQRIEQYQDSLLMLGHSGYLVTCRRALLYCARRYGIELDDGEADRLIDAWRELSSFEDAVRGLSKLKGRYELVVLSNGEPWLLEHLVAQRIKVEFDAIVSVEQAGAFKPHPSVYRTAARVLGREPGEIMMVAAHSFDVMGARACGFRGAYVNRYGLPFEETPYRPDVEVRDFDELAAVLLAES